MDRGGGGSDNGVDTAYTRLEALIRSYGREKKSYEANIGSLKREVSLRQEELESKNQVINQLTFERDALVQERGDDEKSRIGVEALVSNFESKFQIFLEMLTNTQMLVQDTKERCAKLENNNTTIKRSHLKLFAYTNELEAKNTVLEQELDRKCDENLEFKEKNDLLHLSLESFKSENSSLLDTLNDTIKKREDEEKYFNSKLEENESMFKSQIDELNLKLENLNGELEATRKENLELNEKNALSILSLENLKSEKSSLLDTLNETIKKCADDEKHFSSKLEENESLFKSQIDELNLKLEKLNVELEGKCKENLELDEKNSLSLSSLENLKSENSSLLDKLNETIEKCSNDEKYFSSKLEENDSLFKTLVDELNLKLEKLNGELDGKCKENLELNEKNSLAISSLETLKSENLTLLETLNETIKKCADDVETFNLKLEENASLFKGQTDELNLMLEKLNGQLEEKCKENFELTEKHASSILSLENLKSENSSLLDTLNKTLKKCADDEKCFNSKLEETESLLKSQIDELNLKLEKLNEELEEKSNENLELDEKIASSILSLENLKSENSSLLDRLEETTKKSAEDAKHFSSKLEENESSFRTQIDKLNLQLEKLNGELEEVQQKFDYRQGRYEVLVKEYRKLYKEYQTLEKLREKYEKAERENKSKVKKRPSSASASPAKQHGETMQGSSSTSDDPSTSKHLKMDTSTTQQLPPTTPKPTKKKGANSFRRSVPNTTLQPSRSILKGKDQEQQQLSTATSPFKTVSFSSPLYQDFHGLSSSQSSSGGGEGQSQKSQI